MLRDRRPNPEEVSQRNELAEPAERFTILISPTLRRTFQLRAVYGLSIRDTALRLALEFEQSLWIVAETRPAQIQP